MPSFSSPLPPVSDERRLARPAGPRWPMIAASNVLEPAVGAGSAWVHEVDLLHLLGLAEAQLVRAIAELGAVGNANSDLITRRATVIRLVRGREVARVETEYSAEFVSALEQHVTQRRRAHALCGHR
jgi:hypothetical protein